MYKKCAKSEQKRVRQTEKADKVSGEKKGEFKTSTKYTAQKHWDTKHIILEIELHHHRGHNCVWTVGVKQIGEPSQQCKIVITFCAAFVEWYLLEYIFV